MWIFPYIMVEYDRISPSKFVDEHRGCSVSPPQNMQNNLAKPIWESPVKLQTSLKRLDENSERIISCWHAHRCVGKCDTLQPICFDPLFHNSLATYINSTRTPTSDTSSSLCVCRWRNLWRLLKKAWSWGVSVPFLAGPLPNHSLPILSRITNLLLTNLHSIHLTVSRH